MRLSIYLCLILPLTLCASLKEYVLSLGSAGSVRYIYNHDILFHIDRVSSSNEVLYRHSYVYDEKGCLLKEKMIGDLGEILFEKPGVIKSPYHIEICDYDDKGNLIKHTQDSMIREYSYTDARELVAQPVFDKPCTYDDRGNLLQKGDISFTYDDKGHLTHVALTEEDVYYFYDERGKRVGRSCGKCFETYGHLNENEIAVFDESGCLKELRIPGITSHKDLVRPIAIETKDAIYAPIHDLQNNIIKLIDIKTKQVIVLNYPEPFGENLSIDSPTRWIFSGKPYDPKTGLVYFGSRYYCPDLHLWLSQDPARQTPNLYEYCFNNPLSYIDPDGRTSEEAQKHFDNATEALIQAFGHSFAAGVSAEIPPLALFELYNASKCWIEAATEFNAGCRENEKTHHTNQEIKDHTLEVQ